MSPWLTKEGTLGSGDYRYAIVLVHPYSDYWEFVPLQSMRSTETDVAFRAFCNQVEQDIKVVLAYCDAHRSLIKVCENYAVPIRHPPPGHPASNKVVERRVGMALAGVRSFLATVGAPNCVWLFRRARVRR